MNVIKAVWWTVTGADIQRLWHVTWLLCLHLSDDPDVGSRFSRQLLSTSSNQSIRKQHLLKLSATNENTEKENGRFDLDNILKYKSIKYKRTSFNKNTTSYYKHLKLSIQGYKFSTCSLTYTVCFPSSSLTWRGPGQEFLGYLTLGFLLWVRCVRWGANIWSDPWWGNSCFLRTLTLRRRRSRERPASSCSASSYRNAAIAETQELLLFEMYELALEAEEDTVSSPQPDEVPENQLLADSDTNLQEEGRRSSGVQWRRWFRRRVHPAPVTDASEMKGRGLFSNIFSMVCTHLHGK